MEREGFESIFACFMASIEQHRQQIDQLDSKILDLILERIDHVREIRLLKQSKQIPQDTPEREEEILTRLVDKAAGQVSEESVRAIWGTLIREGKLTVRSEDNG